VILFLNKRDLFEEKIESRDLKKCFSDYTGGNDYDAGRKFIAKKFHSVNRVNKPLYEHFTCACDTDNIR